MTFNAGGKMRLFGPWGRAAFPIILLFSFLAGCGYEVTPSPYRLRLPEGGLDLFIPVAENRSRQDYLGPELTRAVISRLTGAPGLRIGGEGSSATLKLNIVSVAVGSGSWEVFSDNSTEIPEASASRVASVSVEAVFTRPNPEGAPMTQRKIFSSSRTYMVSPYQDQVSSQEQAALEWIVSDLSQKIAQGLFTEF
ncbi:MAG: LPS assembly lipoprotein LptE [Deltaproteobacteria bacterium]|jgi:hypothetical protein|nr:LPS assembly lipoprotein LptE [Deltaproteobacteria bacterium]